MYNRFLISREIHNLREPTSPSIIPFFGLRGHYKTAFDKTAVLLAHRAPAKPKADDDPAVPGQDRFLIGIGGSFL
ncbi:MAG TPA: hypothetical protein VGE12_04770 [Noviherbaspirillum sp.]